MNYLEHNQSGLTLLEMMIAVSLFTIVMLISTTLFIRAIDSQQRSVNSKELQEGLNYALAYMANEATGVLQDPSIDCISVPLSCSATNFFCTDNSDTELLFTNAGNRCVVFEIANDAASIPRLQMTRGSDVEFITPASIRITSLKFSVSNTDDATYPIGRATMSITGQTLTGQEYPETLRLQTTVANWP